MFILSRGVLNLFKPLSKFESYMKIFTHNEFHNIKKYYLAKDSINKDNRLILTQALSYSQS